MYRAQRDSILFGKLKGDFPVWRRRSRRKNTIKMDVKDIVCEDMNWAYVPYVRIQWRICTNRILNLPVPYTQVTNYQLSKEGRLISSVLFPCIFLIIFFATRRHLPSILKKPASRLLVVRRQTTKREHKENISFSPIIKKI
jgi:hypothetical protein